MRLLEIIIIVFQVIMISNSNKNTEIINEVKYDDSYLISCSTDAGREEMLEINSKGIVNHVLSIKPDRFFSPCQVHNQLMSIYYGDNIAVLNLVTKQLIEIPDTIDCSPDGFYKNKPYIIYHNSVNGSDEEKILIYDYDKQKTVKVLDGEFPSISILDDTLYFIKEVEKNESERVCKIYSYNIDSDLIKERDSIKVDEYDSIIMDRPISVEKYIYSTFSLYKNMRYVSNTFIFAGIPSEYRDSTLSSDQSALNISNDCKFFCFTENKKDELGMIYYGSSDFTKSIGCYGISPQIINNSIYFISDPTYVKSDDPTFRKFSQVSVYRFNLETMQLGKR